MKLVSDIINELVDTDKSVASPLLKTKVLASRIRNDSLLVWVNSELSGYNSDVPDYRVFGCNITGTYLNGNWRFSDQAFPTQGLPESIGDLYRTIEFKQSVEALESLNRKGGGRLSLPCSAEMIAILQDSIRRMGNPYFQIIAAEKSIPANALSQVLSVVRSKLLDFMLKLDEEFGMVTDLNEMQKNNKRITSIMNQTIITNGDGNVLNTGDSAKLDVKVTVKKMNKQSLSENLLKNGVDEEDVNKLLKVVDLESPNEDGKFGTQVNAWVSSMLNKALDGTWQVSIGAAGGMLAEVIQHYYGLK